MIYFAIWFLFAVAAGAIASDKGRCVACWVVLGFVFGPFALLVLLLPKVPQQAPLETASCTDCGNPVRPGARSCRHCGVRYPYLQPTAREHVLLIRRCVARGYQPTMIAALMNKAAIRPLSGEPQWTAARVAEIYSVNAGPQAPA